MKVVILNWAAGSNDPFSVVNETIRYYFHACGKEVEIIDITDNAWTSRLVELLNERIEFVYTWQGLGSSARFGKQNGSLWSQIKVPLICVHADHPAHMPLNHQLEDRYCFHLYTNAEFARYSNRHFRQMRGASTIDFPQLFFEPYLQQPTGDFFVIAKNISDTAETEIIWQQNFKKPVFDAYMLAAETLKSRIAVETYVDIHDLIDVLIEENNLEWLSPDFNISEYHLFHSRLDFYIRNHKSITALNSIRAFPARIFGRGWDNIAARASPLHSFLPGRNMADSQELYYSRYGLIDISPSKELHDRARRAIDNKCAFLSSASLEDSFNDIDRFDSLFFSYKGSDLPEKCAAVLQNPDDHLLLSQAFSQRYHDRFNFKDFVGKIDLLSKTVTFL